MSQNLNFPHSNQQLACIDQLVTRIINEDIQITEVRKLLIKTCNYPTIYFDRNLIYSDTIHIFYSALDKLYLNGLTLNGVWTDDLIHKFMTKVKMLAQDYQLEIEQFNEQERKNKSSLIAYVGNLINHYERLLFVRVDLKYQSQYQDVVDARLFNEHLSKLRKHISNKHTCFKDLEGYAWAIEQGYEHGGLHCHLLLMYNGSKRHNGWYLSKQIGEKWCEITSKMGTYFNCHEQSRIDYYEANGTRGICMIHRNNENEVQNAVSQSTYLTDPNKYQQRLKAKTAKMKTFGHGTFRNSKRRGIKEPAQCKYPAFLTSSY